MIKFNPFFKILSFAVLLLLFTSPVDASEQGIVVKNTKSTSSTIELTWTSTAPAFQVYDETKLVYQGTSHHFTAKKLTPGTTYTFYIKAMDKDEEYLSESKIQLSTKATASNEADPTAAFNLVTVLTDGVVTLKWDAVTGVSKYYIYKNDQLLKTTTSRTFQDIKFAKDETALYKVTAKKAISSARKKEVDAYLKEQKINPTSSEAKALQYDELSIEKEILGTSTYIHDPSYYSGLSTTKKKQWTLRYTTFLSGHWVKNENSTSKYRYFTGDDRGYSTSSSKYRTRADVNVCFCSSGSSAGLSRSVGLTHGYSKKKKFLKKARASANGIYLTNLSLGKSKIQFTLRHAVGNPLVYAPTIDYYVVGTFYKNGRYKLSGSHDHAPHHEVYLKGYNSSSFKTMHKSASNGLLWLAPPYPDVSWSKSNF